MNTKTDLGLRKQYGGDNKVEISQSHFCLALPRILSSQGVIFLKSVLSNVDKLAVRFFIALIMFSCIEKVTVFGHG